ncbi:MAG: UDP-N-acetylmuramoyl-tripeptide--D-alanyl-D-alanine ligase [Bacteroidetes bacterium]|nr:UDP-N-acetylmuramoyl-tripeptide--D-alanyl-D-alanine ligase [Bacteroidota bacterium]
MQNLFDLFYNSSGVCTDTRKIKKDSLFIALKGENFNGNVFAKDAIVNGAKYGIVDEEDYADSITIFYVPNSLTFLQGLANFHRKKFNIPLIGITGSNGKTTSKELINCVLSAKYKTLCTVGNLNNHIGVPLTLLSIDSSHEIAIIEMGANKPGDIQELVDIAEPNYGIITNIGKAHLEGFKTLEGVIKTKTELFSFIDKTNGAIIFNSDDIIISNECSKLPNKFAYGTNEDVKIKGKLIELNPFVVLQWNHENYESPQIQTKLVGSYNFYNFLAAISFGVHFEVPYEQINKAIESYTPTNNRSQVMKTDKNTLIVDCYNANPSSMRSALESFVSNIQPNKIAILGDMLELGTDSITEHHKIIEYCKENYLTFITVGKLFKEINENGFESISDLESYLTENSIANKSILLKGSRGISLEKIIPML